MSKSISIALTQELLIETAKATGVTVVPCERNGKRCTLLSGGERVDAFTEGEDTTLYFYTDRRVGADTYHPMPLILERMLCLLGMLEANV